MARLVEQLRQLRSDLVALLDRDPEQEVTGQALPLLDKIVAEARDALPRSSTLRDQIPDVITVEMIESGSVRAAEVLIIVGQLLAVLDTGNDEGQLVLDRLLFEKFRQILSSTTDTVRFLRQPVFGSRFRSELFRPLEILIDDWNDAEHQFIAPGVQVAFKAFCRAVLDFLDRLAEVSLNDGDAWETIVPAERRDTFRITGPRDDAALAAPSWLAL